MSFLATRDAVGSNSPLQAIQQHLTKFDALATYEDVSSWDNIAKVYLRELDNELRRCEDQNRLLLRQRADADAAHRGKSLIARAFGTSPVAKIQVTIDDLARHIDKLSQLLELIQANIDFSPNDPQSKKEVIQELRLRKKALQLEKREIAHGMQALRVEARQMSATANTSLAGLLGGRKGTALQRQAIRRSKESAIAPHEQEKARIEWELMTIDKMILWVERIR